MKALILQFRTLDPAARVLCLNQFGINLGFYMLMPYLAGHLTGDLGLAAGVAGLVLGARNLCQQGMFLLGGTLADRLGCKPMIVAGCVLRTVAFTLLAAAPSLPGLLTGMALTGLAGALFNPAVRAYLAAASGERRVDSFAVFNVFYQAGILAGPLVGLALTAIDFTTTCLVAAVVFAALAAVQMRSLPSQKASESDRAEPVLRSWRTVAANRPFVLFSLAMAGSYVLGFQIYLALPLLVGDGTTTGGIAATTGMFAVSAVITIAGQIRVTAWCKARFGGSRSMEHGLLVMSAAFALPALALAAAVSHPVMIATALAGAALLAVATMVIYPFEMDTIVALADGKHAATHYGFYNTVVGIAITVGNLLVGAALDATAGRATAPIPWLGMALLGTVGMAGLGLLRRRGLLFPRAPSRTPVSAT